MKIKVIAEDSLSKWNLKNGTDILAEDLTDEQFLEINKDYDDGWGFGSIDEFVDAFNYDTPYAPSSVCSYLRAFDDDKVKEPKLFDYFVQGATLKEMVGVINAYEEWRGTEAEESIYDLYNDYDFDLFANMYGTQTANRCKEKGQYWYGGYAFYANEDDKSLGCCAKIFNVTKDNVLSDVKNALSEFEDFFETALADNNGNIEDTCDYLSSAFDGTPGAGLVDFNAYAKAKYGEQKTVKKVFRFHCDSWVDIVGEGKDDNDAEANAKDKYDKGDYNGEIGDNYENSFEDVTNIYLEKNLSF